MAVPSVPTGPRERGAGGATRLCVSRNPWKVVLVLSMLRRGGGVRKSLEGAVKAYIAGQREHHKKEDFKSKLLRMLRLREIEFDERYVFD